MTVQESKAQPLVVKVWFMSDGRELGGQKKISVSQCLRFHSRVKLIKKKKNLFVDCCGRLNKMNISTYLKNKHST